MAKGDDLYKNAPQNNQINNNALMGRGGMEQAGAGLGSQPFGGGNFGGMAGGGLLQSLMPLLQMLQQQGNNRGGVPSNPNSNSPINRGIGGAGAIRQGIQRLKGGGSSMGGNPPPNPFEQGRSRAQDSINRASQRFNAPPMMAGGDSSIGGGSGGMGGGSFAMPPSLFPMSGGGLFPGNNDTLPNQSNQPMLQRPGFLSSLMGGNSGQMRGFNNG